MAAYRGELGIATQAVDEIWWEEVSGGLGTRP